MNEGAPKGPGAGSRIIGIWDSGQSGQRYRGPDNRTFKGLVCDRIMPWADHMEHLHPEARRWHRRIGDVLHRLIQRPTKDT